MEGINDGSDMQPNWDDNKRCASNSFHSSISLYTLTIIPLPLSHQSPYLQTSARPNEGGVTTLGCLGSIMNTVREGLLETSRSEFLDALGHDGVACRVGDVFGGLIFGGVGVVDLGVG